MTDDGTTYDEQGLNVELTGERSLNGAHALGYPLDVRPDPAWPGLSGAAGEVRARPEEMGRVVSWLESRSDALQDLPTWLGQRTGGVRFGPSSWHEANNLQDACAQLSSAVTGFVAELTTNMRQAAGSVRAAGAAVTTADTTGADAFDAVGSGFGGPPAGGSAGAGGAGGGSGSW